MMLFTAAVLLLTASCSKDDDEPQQVNPPVAAGARLQVMMVFAPGQLGDGGYADGLLEYASGMEFLEIMPDAEDSIDVQFISLYSVNDTRQALKEWAAAVSIIIKSLFFFIPYYIILYHFGNFGTSTLIKPTGGSW